MPRLGENAAGAERPTDSLATCPLVCIGYQRENPPNSRGRVTSTYYSLCGQRVLRSEWLKELLAGGLSV